MACTQGSAAWELDSVRLVSSICEPQPGRAPVREGVLALPTPLPLHHGGTLAGAQLAWRLVGDPALPVVVAIGGISAHRRVFDLERPENGWWREVVGPGLALDTRRCALLGFDYLGAQGDSTAARAGEPFPSLSSYDQAEALAALLDHLRVPRIRAIAGASYGGMVALAFAERYGQRVERLVVISAADRAHPLSTAWRSVQRRTVRFALAAGRGAAGLELARALAMTTYRSPEEFAARFDAPPHQVDGGFVFPVEDYLYARGRDYAVRVQPEHFLCLSESIDLHRIDAARVNVPCAVVAVREDLLVPLGDLRALVARLPRGELVVISSPHGHDAFLKEPVQLKPVFDTLYGDL
ncbi:MAG: homoserine O-succinyltransferase [Gammaproteobacteria bacterium]|nr:homoserine O-succinyltransferase [Gammaproteobacteria bacterium]